MKVIAKKVLSGNLIITDPLYIVKQEKLEDLSTKPRKEKFYPENWTPPTEEDYFNNTEKALIAKRCEQNYKEAIESWQEMLPNDWDVCNYGENMNHLGLKKFIIADTIYGPWSCTVYNLRQQMLGRFTSDSGLVGVFLLDEILEYNPKWDLHLSRPYCASLLPNFEGEVCIINSGGNLAGDCDVRVIGKGNFAFYSKQTGF